VASEFRINSALEGQLRRVAGVALFRCAVAAEEQLRKELDRPYPPASTVGEFPRRRSGDLRRSVVLEPNNVGSISRKLRVRLRYSAKGFYGDILAAKGRKGPADVVASMGDAFSAALARADL
jgi:hypothetical protein